MITAQVYRAPKPAMLVGFPDTKSLTDLAHIGVAYGYLDQSHNSRRLFEPPQIQECWPGSPCSQLLIWSKNTSLSQVRWIYWKWYTSRTLGIPFVTQDFKLLTKVYLQVWDVPFVSQGRLNHQDPPFCWHNKTNKLSALFQKAERPPKPKKTLWGMSIVSGSSAPTSFSYTINSTVMLFPIPLMRNSFNQGCLHPWHLFKFIVCLRLLFRRERERKKRSVSAFSETERM